MSEKRKPYYLVVNDVLVKVVKKEQEEEKEEEEKKQIDETPLLELLATYESRAKRNQGYSFIILLLLL